MKTCARKSFKILSMIQNNR